jgi:hypothetical protein
VAPGVALEVAAPLRVVQEPEPEQEQEPVLVLVLSGRRKFPQ